jgi:hypothetical protein
MLLFLYEIKVVLSESLIQVKVQSHIVNHRRGILIVEEEIANDVLKGAELAHLVARLRHAISINKIANVISHHFFEVLISRLMHAVEVVIYRVRSWSIYLMVEILVISDLVFFIFGYAYQLCLKIVQSHLSIVKQLFDVHDIEGECLYDLSPVDSSHVRASIDVCSLRFALFAVFVIPLQVFLQVLIPDMITIEH